MSRPDFDLVWASSRAGGLPVDTITDAQWQQGWLYRAGVPPLTINFDYYQNLNDLRVTWLADQLPLTGVSAFAKTILDDTDAATVRATIGANNADNLTAGTLSVNRLGASGATAGAYGSSTKIPRVTVDDKGRVTGIVEYNLAVSSASESIAGIALEASQLEVNSGTAGSKFITPSKNRSGFNFNSNTGIDYPDWMGGYKRRWGYLVIAHDTSAYTGDLFPNACSAAMVCLGFASTSDYQPPKIVPQGKGARIYNSDNDTITVRYLLEGY